MSTTNILDLNNRIDELEKNSGGGGSADSAKRSDIATEFSTETSYTAGNFVYYEGKLYQFNADHSAGAWDPTDVVEANVTDQVVSNKSDIAALESSISQKTYGAAVNIATATQADPFTCPSDGVVNIQSGYASTNYTALFKVGWTGFMAIAKGNESQANGAMTVPVLKGDQLYVQTSGSDPVANYYPYE